MDARQPVAGGQALVRAWAPDEPQGPLVRAAERWRGLRFTEFELRQIAAVRKDLDTEYEAMITRSDRASQTRLSSRSVP